MSSINVLNVEVLQNPCSFVEPFRFQITFECLPPGVRESLEWKLVYVGSADDEQFDQELESAEVGPVNIGTNQFIFQAPPPNPARIPAEDLLGATVVLLTCAYRGNEFIRIGYYVHNDYGEKMELNENPPNPPLWNEIRRSLNEVPIVTKFRIAWDDEPVYDFNNMDAAENSNQSVDRGAIQAMFSHHQQQSPQPQQFQQQQQHPPQQQPQYQQRLQFQPQQQQQQQQQHFAPAALGKQSPPRSDRLE